MITNRIILRSLNSPWVTTPPDITKGSVLSHADVDNNFINLKGEIIYTAETSGNTITLKKINGNDILLTIEGGNVTANTYTTGATLIGTTAYFDRTDTLSAYTLNLDSLTPTLSQVLINGNVTGNNDIIITNGQLIRTTGSTGNTNSINLDSSSSNAWDITTNQYNTGSAWVYGQPENGSQLGLQISPSEAIGIGVFYENIIPELYNAKEIVITDNSIFVANSGTNNKKSVIIGSRNSNINSGLTNTVVIGGENITASLNNKVYISDLNIQTVNTASTATTVSAIGVDATGNVVKATSGGSYKVYTAMLTQTDTDAPTAIVLENYIGTITFTYVSAGLYKAVSNGLFTLNKTIAFATATCATLSFQIEPLDENEISIQLSLAGDGNLCNSPFEIRVYN